ncbi:hypothetical protein PENTCL1PPCAC_4149, partial [Pristionchus entomophagus]
MVTKLLLVRCRAACVTSSRRMNSISSRYNWSTMKFISKRKILNVHWPKSSYPTTITQSEPP